MLQGMPNNDVQSKTKKEERNEQASDRESSVESFHTNKSEISTATESELIDVDDIELSDEESWLYKSPKKLASTDKELSTFKWLQEDVKDLNNLELQNTKDALVSKLNQLQMQNSDMEKKIAKENSKFVNNKVTEKVRPSITDKPVSVADGGSRSIEMRDDKTEEQAMSSVKGKENELLDVADVHKIAQLQEESLRQSTCRFLTMAEKKGQDKNFFFLQNKKLSKPASFEALNLSNGKLNDETAYSLVPMQTMKKQNFFSSSSSLHNQQDAHRGSLPNINPGYYSLRSKKSKKPTDPKLPCPLPIYPSHSRLMMNGTGSDVSTYESQNKLTSPLGDCRESRTLPSSYRSHSRSSSTRREPCSLSPSPRRESTSFLPRSGPTPGFTRRESAPCNAPKYLSPLSSPTLYQRNNFSSSVLQSPTKTRRNPPKDLKTPPGTEYHRNTSHSPSRRLPLSTMHNHSPKRGNSPASPHTEELRGFKITSKIPSPASRSGIPVPSTYMSRTNSEEDSWSHDCF